MSDGRLLQVERELDRIFASLGHGMYVVDEERRILLWNKAAESILGWTENEALGRSCRDFIGHMDDEGNQVCDEECPLNAAMGKSQTLYAGTVWGHSRSGKEVPLNVSCAPLIDDDGRLAGAVEVFSDMTREKEVERLKNEIVSVVALELRTPLTSMKGYLELVIAGDVGDVNEEQRHFLNIVESNVLKLEELMNDLLDLGKLESGRTTMHWEELDLESIVREGIDTFIPLARDKSLSLTFEVVETSVIRGDRQLLGRAVSNLVSNAIKYSNEGGVTVRLDREGERAVLEVADTGVGIPQEELGRVFERFFRASTASETSSTGSGLGLAITAEIVDKHKGELKAESVMGKGSRFTVRLPCTQTKPGYSKAKTGTPTAEKYLVVVTEDDPQIAKLIKFKLEKSGYEVLWGENGKLGLELIKEHKPDLVILDVMMPIMDGFEVLRMMKADERIREIPVILLTARSMEEDILKGFETGAVDYLTKPFSVSELAARVKSILAMKK